MSRQTKLILAFSAVYFVWGSTYLAIKYGIETMPPFMMMGFRFLVAGLLLLVMGSRSKNWIPNKVQFKKLLIMALTMVVLGTGIMAWVEHYVPSGIAALVVAISPVWFVFLESLLPNGKTPGYRGLAGVFIGLLGLMMLISPTEGSQPIAWFPLTVLVFSSFCWAAGSIYHRHAGLGMNALLATAWQMVLGGIALLLIGVGFGEASQINPNALSMRSVAALCYLVVFGSLLVFPAYNWLISNCSPILVGTHAYVNPIVALALGWLFAGESVTTRTVVAALIIVSSVFLIGTDRGSGNTIKRGRWSFLQRLRLAKLRVS